ncbi:MAG: WecB/TagA/CpsF family glycosyltransferase [Polyangiales bacterium]
MRLGNLWIDRVTFRGALDAIADLVELGQGGSVFTPNVDHVVLADEDQRLRAAYASVDLSLVDGVPVLWASRLFGARLPEKVSGSDLIMPLLAMAARKAWRVYLLGGDEGIPQRAAEALRRSYPSLVIVGMDSPRIDLSAPSFDEVVHRIRAAKPDLMLVALGCPKQEIFIHRVEDAIRPVVAVAIGAGLDFVAGAVPRAPTWLSSLGLEWAYRLAREPRRLWRRYLVRDPKFLWILLRELRARRQRR